MTSQFAVIGLGLFGSAVATTLAEQGHHVLGIDIDEKAASTLMRVLSEVVTVTEVNEAILQSLSITEYDAVVIGITNIEASLTIAQMLRDLGVTHIVCKAKSALHGKILQRIGVDRVIYPERDMGIRVAQNLVAKSITGSIVLSAQQHIVTAPAPASCIGHPVGTIQWQTETKISVLAIQRGAEVIAHPVATFAIADGDMLVMLGTSADIATLLK
jgi:trk system potassium uptake protein TrkA